MLVPGSNEEADRILHEYKLAQFGLSKEQLEPHFERYLSRYDIEPEGK